MCTAACLPARPHLFITCFPPPPPSPQGSVLPAIHCLGMPELGWHLVVLMTLTLYVGNAMKDLVCAPRPLGLRYGKARLAYLGKGSEEAELNAMEYGLPSSHTMNSLCLNLYACHYLHEQEIISDDVAGEESRCLAR